MKNNIYLEHVEKQIAEIDKKLRTRQVPRNRYGLQQKKKAYEEMRDFLIKNPIDEYATPRLAFS